MYKFTIKLSIIYVLSMMMFAMSQYGCEEDQSHDHLISTQSVTTEQVITDERLTKVGEGKDDSSAAALFLNYEFDGKIKLRSRYWPENSIENQLLYSVGQLNGDRSVGRLDKLELSDIETTRLEDGNFEISYHAKMIVAWGKSTKIFPEFYTLILPYDQSSEGIEVFTDKYKDTCVDWSAHDVDSSSIWYYYRPFMSRCKLDESDIIRADGSMEVSEVTTIRKYPEYHKVWEDDVLKVVAIFGHAKEEEEDPWDQGVSAYQDFFGQAKFLLYGAEIKVTPEIPYRPKRDQTEYQIDGVFPDGRRVQINALSVVNVRTAGADFDQRYHELSAEADLIVYNGHAGLGANVRALARKGNWQTGQYVMVFMNGCDTYAYVDQALFESHAHINADDEIGTRYVDVLNNVMPSYFSSMSRATSIVVSALVDKDEPLNYEQIFKGIDPQQIILVTGEEDNEFVPNAGDVADPWENISIEATLTRGEEVRFDTPMLDVGTYRFTMQGTQDADLYVRLGLEPSVEAFDCRPYSVGSQEVCEIVLDRPVHIFAMVRGWSTKSEVRVEVTRITQ